MRYEEDWLLRQIYQLINVLIYLVFNKRSLDAEILDDFTISEEYQNLLALVAAGKINEAENLLFEWKSQGKVLNEIAILFYQKLNELGDSALEDSDFSREEIRRGLLEYFEMPEGE